MAEPREWRDLGAPSADSEEVQIDEYDLSSSPNDFNVVTIHNFIESGAVKVPGFQRNYVWDIKRASKLIESLILGLPVPQVFLYEEDRNRFLVIDGQQRLMTIYFFVKQRFPKRSKRAELRRLLAGSSVISPELLHNDELFENFSLRLAGLATGKKNRFLGLNYSTLGDYKTQFDLRTIRNVIVKQVRPSGDDSSIYEMFNRLNTGGINLTPQEIRASLYYSNLYDMLGDVNMRPSWRKLVGIPEPDVHLRDVEILLRAIAMFDARGEYVSSMAQFLNNYSHKGRKFALDKIAILRGQLEWFIDSVASQIDKDHVFSSRTGRFSVTLFEATFAAAVRLRGERGETWVVKAGVIKQVRDDPSFMTFTQAGSNTKANVIGRLDLAYEVLRAAP